MNSTRNPFIVPVFLPHAGCPHRCIFCNQFAVSSVAAPPSPFGLENTINRFLGYVTDRPPDIQIAFYGGNFLGLSDTHVAELLSRAQQFVRKGRVDSIRFSTRPDTIDEHRLRLISEYSVRTVEIGAQSMDDGVLALTRRGHTAAQTASAVRQLKEKGYSIGLQMMVGLPGDTIDRSLGTARRLAELQPDLVRIYPTVVLQNSRLAALYRKGRYRPLSIQEAVEIVMYAYLIFRQGGIPVVRMGLQASTELEDGDAIVAGPYHPAFGHMVHAALFQEMGRRLLSDGGHYGKRTLFYTHPRSISKMKGLKQSNTASLCREFALKDLNVAPDPEVPVDGLRLDDRGASSLTLIWPWSRRDRKNGPTRPEHATRCASIGLYLLTQFNYSG